MILLLDNYDSFTYNVAHAFGALGREVKVVRSDTVSLDQIEDMEPEAIVISPGPGRPEDAGLSCPAIERFAGRVPILGVCLGHQAIGLVFGGKVVRANRLVHGKTSDIFHDGRTLYQGLRNPFAATRYHSLIVPEESVSGPLEVSAYTLDGEVMGLRCPDLMVEGVQFHPESIATPQGGLIFRNFVDRYLAFQEAA
ncbi:MAG: aminodeoxychorismate/anthranilate synthase component II [Proteobacteria bacterium]|nr:aminodeoxychorismate/anthranilate synthase component II [Pseudomonadota bacterium]